MSEHSRIRALRARLERSRADIELGIGDDAAVLAPSRASMVCTVDACVENVHFQRRWLSLRDLGRRAYIAAMSDVAAMGAKPRAALLALALPASVSDEELLELVDGVAEGADECQAPVIGGNLSAAGEISITTTVLGEVVGRALARSGARPGDGIYVTGTVGAAAVGCLALESGRASEALLAPFVERWRRPVAKLTEGQRLRELATAAIDLSDGLLQDLEHLCQASGVGATIRLADLPLMGEHGKAADALGASASNLALGGGEDYELLFAAPTGTSVDRIGTRIGMITPRDGHIEVIGDGGHPMDLSVVPGGFDHFAPR